MARKSAAQRAGPGPTHAVTYEAILKQLGETAAPIAELDLAPAAGVYAWFLAKGATLAKVSNPAGGAIYIGKSSNLAQREFDTHFAVGKTGFSTLRRSLGAILKDKLSLSCEPRGTGTSKTNFINYRFDDAGEARLSEWMIQHLRVGTYAVDFDDLQAHEAQMIALACPPLNLTGWKNPEARAIRELRKVCADQARAAHPR